MKREVEPREQFHLAKGFDLGEPDEAQSHENVPDEHHAPGADAIDQETLQGTQHRTFNSRK